MIGGLAVALVSFADTSVLSRTYAARTGTKVDPNQEIVGLGAANLAAGFFQGFPISSSSSRTPVAEAAGSKTQLTGVVGALTVALVLIAAPNLLRHLPNSALAAVVIAAAIGLFEFAELRRIWRIQRWEFWLSIACSRGRRVARSDPRHRPRDRHRRHRVPVGWLASALRDPGTRRWSARDTTTSSATREARRVPGLVLFRWDAPLFFANAELFHERVIEAVAASPTPARRVVVAAEPVTSVDVTAADMLAELDANSAPPASSFASPR